MWIINRFIKAYIAPVCVMSIVGPYRQYHIRNVHCMPKIVRYKKKIYEQHLIKKGSSYKCVMAVCQNHNVCVILHIIQP